MSRIILAALAACLAFGPGAFAQDDPPEPPLPQPRPDNLGKAASEDVSTETGAGTSFGRVYQTACPALLTGRIIGELQPPVSEGQCGLQNPVADSAVIANGRQIALAGGLAINCAMATTLADWAEAVDSHARATLGTGIGSLVTGPGYQCRLRYGADEGFLSEHGRGNAIDIAAIGFEDGSRVSILEDWRRLPLDEEARFLAFAHGAACSRFTTVLGPAANQDHEDHVHFDLGCHGQSCTAVICEQVTGSICPLVDDRVAGLPIPAWRDSIGVHLAFGSWSG